MWGSPVTLKWLTRVIAAAGAFSGVTGGMPLLTSAGAGGGAPGPPKLCEGGNREGALSPATQLR